MKQDMIVILDLGSEENPTTCPRDSRVGSLHVRFIPTILHCRGAGKRCPA